MNILIVDENRDELAKLEEYVRMSYPCHSVVRFSDPCQAVEYSIAHPVDMVFTEINMRPLDGFSLVHKLRENNPEIRVNFVSQTGEYAVDAFRIRADGYFLKPVTRESFGDYRETI